MTEETISKIEITKEIPFLGRGNTLESRLRNVRLRGFPHIKIYEEAVFQFNDLTPKQIQTRLHTPQLRVYRTHLNKIKELAHLFKEQGIDILYLDKAYDFIATSESDQETEWTILPPVVESFFIPEKDGKLDYTRLIGTKLNHLLIKNDLKLNPEALKLASTSKDGIYNLINDGSHRIHYGFENKGIRILRVMPPITPGFPYYAAPQPYQVKVFNTREEALQYPKTKIHIIEEPGHKNLYRSFPTGNIKSGDVRPSKTK